MNCATKVKRVCPVAVKAAVVGIEDIEAGTQARDFRLVAKLAGGKTMVGAEPGWRLDTAEGRADAGQGAD